MDKTQFRSGNTQNWVNATAVQKLAQQERRQFKVLKCDICNVSLFEKAQSKEVNEVIVHTGSSQELGLHIYLMQPKLKEMLTQGTYNAVLHIDSSRGLAIGPRYICHENLKQIQNYIAVMKINGYLVTQFEMITNNHGEYYFRMWLESAVETYKVRNIPWVHTKGA